MTKSYAVAGARRLLLSTSAFAMAVAFMGAAWAQSAGDAAEIETVTVSGFRESLAKALDKKRNALDSSDSIMAEDIAKFPDMNVSESLQRIPGVALQRAGGEGRQISVRGLGPIFTRVRINGMEAMATAGSTDGGADANAVGGTNRTRSFDFNVFGSELFSGLTVHKSASASTEEGSLGATVDMHTALPFDYNKFILAGSLQGGYNSLAGSFNPRVSGMYADVFAGGRLGVLISGAYTLRHYIEDGTSTVRWMNDNTARTSDGSSPNISGCSSSAGCTASQRFGSVTGDTDLVDEANHPRMPRYEVFRGNEKRLGLSSSVQWQQDENTLLTLTGLFSDFSSIRDEYQLESTSLSSTSGSTAINGVSVTSYDVNTTTNTLDYMVANGVSLRTEHSLYHTDTKFEELTLDGTHSFSNSFKIHLLGGWSESHFRSPIQTTLLLDLNGAQGYTYDYRGSYSKEPLLNYGSADVMNPGSTLCSSSTTAENSCNAWYLSGIRMRPQAVFNSLRTAQADFEYDVTGAIKLQGGFEYKGYGFNSISKRLQNGSSDITNVESISSKYGVASTSANVLGLYGSSNLNAIIGTPVSSYAKNAVLPSSGLSIPTGTPTTWVVADINKAVQLFGLNKLNMGIYPDLGNNRTIHEADFGGWLQVAWQYDLFGMPFRGDIGGRLVETELGTDGYSINATSGAYEAAVGSSNYHDFLPSLNAVLEPTDDLVLRLNIAQVMARPDLNNLVGTTVTYVGANRLISIGNPTLKPYRANTVDLAAEWYYSPGAMLSIAGFYKKVGTFIQTYTASVSAANASSPLVFQPYGVASTSIPFSALNAACGGSSSCALSKWSTTEAINTPGGNIDGMEINWQQPFEFLPHPFNSFGFMGNVTFVDASVKYANTSSTLITTTPVNMSKWSYNTTLYYDDTVFQARVSGSFRSRYYNTNPGKYADIDGNDATFNLDASASYKVDQNLTVTFDALNLTNQFQSQYNGSVAQNSHVYHQTGTDLYVGVRYNY